MPAVTIMKYPAALLAVVLINLVVGAISIAYGVDFLVAPASQPGFHRYVTVVVLLLVVASGVLAWSERRDPVDGPQAMDLLALLCGLQLSLTLFFNLPTKPAAAAIVAVLAAGAALVWWRRSAAAVALAVAAGCAIYVGSIIAVPPSTPGADMLPFISHAIDVFAAGRDPYTADYSAIDSNPFFYPPGQWLIYLPWQEAGVDLRALNLLSAFLMVGLTEWQVRAGKLPASLRLGVYPLMLSPLVLPMMHSGQVWPYWLAIEVFALLVLDRQWVWAAVAAALAVGIRPTALVPALSIFAALLGRIRFTAWLRAALAGGLALVATVLPFVASRAALEMMVLTGPARALANAHEQGNPASQIALSNILDWLGLAARDSQMELLLAVLTLIGARFALRRGVAPMLAVAGVGYVATISANPYLHRYYYVAGLLLAGIGFAVAAGDTTRRFQTSVADIA